MFISLRSRIRQVFLLGLVSGAALLVLGVGQASAATYPSGGSTFTGSAEGWFVPAKECKLLGTVELGLLCENEGEYTQAAGNPPGSFDAHTKGIVNAASVFDSKVTLQSPDFTVSSGGPATLHLDRQLVLSGIVKLGPNSGYKVVLLDKTSGTQSNLMEASLSEESASFMGENAAATVTAGHTYAIQILTEAKSEAKVGLLTSTTDMRFDNVGLTVGNGGEGPGGGGGGGGGSGAGGGSGSLTNSQLSSILQSSSLVGPAVLKGNKITVKAKCPAKLKATCTLTLQGMLTKHKAATAKRRARVKKGKTKKFVIKVKPAALKKVKAKKKLLFKETARVGKAHATVYKTLKLVRR
ncbi:MAG TPA: hypothetical protein VMH33_08160 [Solirubrobacterales bacterium]|nr:hypothetical protein [Solirubrobacterales bacterium]